MRPMTLDTVAQIIAFVGLLVFAAHLFTGIFSKTRIPDVLLLIAIGIVVGPLLGLVSPDQFGSVGPICADDFIPFFTDAVSVVPSMP